MKNIANRDLYIDRQRCGARADGAPTFCFTILPKHKLQTYGSKVLPQLLPIQLVNPAHSLIVEKSTNPNRLGPSLILKKELSQHNESH